MTALYELKNVTKVYRGRTALSIPALTLDEGRCCAITGSNGVGKTTLVDLLAGLVVPTAGTVLYRGHLTGGISGEVAFVSESPYLFRATVHENVEYGLRCRGVPRRRRRASAERALEEMGLGRLSVRCARELSHGERQRVAVARALVLETATLLLDEPLSGVDAEHERDIMAVLERLKSVGRTIIFSALDSGPMRALADRVITLGNGGVVAIDTERTPANE